MVYQFFKGSGGISFVDWLVWSGGGLRLKGKLTPGKFISFFLLRVIFLYNGYCKSCIIVSIIDFFIPRYIDSMILLYANEIQEELPIDRINHKGIAKFNIVATDRMNSLLEKLKSHNIQPLFVPAAIFG